MCMLASCPNDRNLSQVSRYYLQVFLANFQKSTAFQKQTLPGVVFLDFAELITDLEIVWTIRMCKIDSETKSDASYIYGFRAFIALVSSTGAVRVRRSHTLRPVAVGPR